MNAKVLQSLEGVSETLLIPLYARARETQRPDGFIRDEHAVELVSRIDYDFSRIRLARHDELAVIMRMGKFDSLVCDFLARNPEAVVVHIGCGLDMRFERVDNGQVRWFDLDMPDVIALRRKLIHNECSRCQMLAASVFDDSWLEETRCFKPRPFLFVAEGVLPYFEEAQVKGLFLKLRDHFPGCELVFDAHKPFMIKMDNLHLVVSRVRARLHWGLKDSRDVETWGDGIHLLHEWYYDEDPEFDAFRWMKFVPLLARSSGIYHYLLGVQP